MYNVDDFEERISIKFLQTLNRHLPARRKMLKELLREERPSVKNQDSSTHFFEKKELEKIASMLPEFEYDKLRLPIYLEMSSSMERGAIRISGQIECRIINMAVYEDSERNESKDSMIIYYPHLKIVRNEFRTATQFMFTL